MSNTGSHEIEVVKVDLSVSDGTSMPAHVARPACAGPHPGLMVFQEAFGVNAHIREVTERFARAGYVAIAPALFHRTDANFEGSYTDFAPVMPHMQALNTEDMTADILATHAWLRSESGGGAAVVGAVGYCLGGRVSFLADAVAPIQAAVSYYGGGIAPGPRGPGLLEHTANLHAPILLIWGGEDKHIPPEQTRAIEDALIAAQKTYAQITFSYADHGFFCDVRASYSPDAAAQSWALTLAFLESNLRS